jgi:hypothetical protein
MSLLSIQSEYESTVTLRRMRHDRVKVYLVWKNFQHMHFT